MSRERSHAIFARAKQLMPGGVNSPARAFGGVGGEPIFIDRAEGAYLYDIDGNRYIDYIGSWGPMILGHGHPAVTAAVEAAVHRGTSFGAPTAAENELAELIIEAVPSIEKVRLVNSGTEATMSAIRLARGYTGRDRDRQVRRQLPRPRRQPAGGGRQLGRHAGRAQLAGRDRRHRPATRCAAATTTSPPWRTPLPQHGPRIAGVIVEPVVGNMGCVMPRREFRQALRELTAAARRAADLRRSDDRLPRGLRRGPVAVRHHARPDHAGQDHRRRAAGGGLRRPGRDHGPRAAGRQGVPGRHAQRQSRWPRRPGIATLRDPPRTNRPTRGWSSCRARLAAGLDDAATAAGVPHTIARVGSMMTLFFNAGPGDRLGHGQPLRHARATPGTSGA